MRTFARRVVAAVVVTAAATASAAAQNLTYSGSLGYTTGSYIFSETTRSFALSNRLSLSTSRVRMGVNVPVVYQNTSALAFINGVPVPTGGRDGPLVRQRQPGQNVPMEPKRTGHANGMSSLLASISADGDSVAGPGSYQLNLADPVMNLGVELLDGRSVVRSLELVGYAKAPVASIESGVGTEAWDVGGGLTVAAGTGTLLVFADATYWSYGDMPELELRDGFAWGGGIGLSLSERISLMASYAGMQRIVPTADAASSIAVAAGYALSPARRLTFGAGFGLTESASDLSLFVGWSAALSRPPPSLSSRAGSR
jgi:hypothetical protein